MADQVSSTERLVAFVCDGTCGAALDRPFTCGNTDCSLFGYPFREESDRVERRPIDGYCHVVPSDAAQAPKLVLNATQLPAAVPVVECGPHLEPFHPSAGQIVPLAMAPEMDTEWKNRHVIFSNVKLRLKDNLDAPQPCENYILAYPGQEILILSAHFRCAWRRQASDYCPGCVIQWYFGLNSANLCVNLVEHYVNGKRGKLTESPITFKAPSTPGIYYLTTAITLDYSFQPNRKFDNKPHNSIAAIQVVYFDRWKPSTHFLLPWETRQEIQALSLLGSHPNAAVHMTKHGKSCPCRVIQLEELRSRIFSFLGPYRD